MSSLVSKEKRVKIKAVTSIFISTMLIVVLQKNDLINTAADKINYAKNLNTSILNSNEGDINALFETLEEFSKN